MIKNKRERTVHGSKKAKEEGTYSKGKERLKNNGFTILNRGKDRRMGQYWVALKGILARI